MKKTILSDPLLDKAGIEVEKVQFTGKYAGLLWQLEQQATRIKQAQVIMIIMAIIILIPLFIQLSKGGIDSLGLFNLFLGLVFLLSGILLKKSITVLIILPLSVFLTYVLLELILSPGSFFGGLIWKIFFPSFLAYLLYQTLSANKAKKALVEYALEASKKREDNLNH